MRNHLCLFKLINNLANLAAESLSSCSSSLARSSQRICSIPSAP